MRTFLGSTSNTIINCFAAGSTASDYTTAKATCSGVIDARTCESGVTSATDGGGQYYVSARSQCKCDKYMLNYAPVFIIPSAGDSTSNLYQRAIHEYVHAVQMAFGAPMPAWLMEGGAVFMECVMSNRDADGTHGGSDTSFSQCLQFGGGRGGVIKNLRQLYSKSPGNNVQWLTKYGADRQCNNDLGPNGAPPGLIEGAETSWIFYDTGAYAIAFAIVKANQNQASDGGRTLVDFWTGQGMNGFWHEVEPSEINLMTGWPSEVPEGEGWKKALSDFTGYASVAAFYAAFEEFVAPNGVLKSEQELLDFVANGGMSNSEVATLNLVQASYSSFVPRMPPQATPEDCSGGTTKKSTTGGGGSNSPAPSSGGSGTGSTTGGGSNSPAPSSGGSGTVSEESSSCCTSRSGILFWVVLAVAVYLGQDFSFTAVHDWDTVSSSTSEMQHLTRAWTLISTFDAYPTWNTFTTSVTTSQPPVPGQPVQLAVTLGQPFPLSYFYPNETSFSKMTLDFFWKEYSPSKHKMCWGIQNPTFPLLDIFLTSHRCCELRYQPNVGVQVRHTDLNQGLVAPLVQLSYQTTIEKGFAVMTRDMKRELARKL